MRQRTVTIGGFVAGVVWCALVFAFVRMFFALVRMPGMEWLPALLLFTVGPICGANAQRFWGGRGILGGVIGGIASCVAVGLGVVMYMRGNLPRPNAAAYVGLGLFFLVLASSGALVGLAVGILVRGVMRIYGPRGKTGTPCPSEEPGLPGAPRPCD